MLEVVYKSQMTYPYGKCMCTTACMTLSIALLSKRIDLSVMNYEYTRRWLKSIMTVADRIQERIETKFDSGPMATNVRDYINIMGVKHTIPNAHLMEYIINDELGDFGFLFAHF